MKNTKTILHAMLLLIGLISFNTQAGVEITYMHNDALGSAVAGTDEQGNVKWRSHYQPYGTEMLGQRGASGVRSGYTGHRDDPDSGLTYMGARYYSPSIGRFMGIDPVGVSESNQHSFNRYTYANNNPYKYVDPDGEHPILIFIAKEAFGEAIAEITGIEWFSTRRAVTKGGKEVAGRIITNSKGVAKGAGSAKNPASGLKLNKQLGSQQQLGEKGTTIAGPGAKRPFRDAERAASDHGGNPSDFVKKRSSAHTAPDGTKFRTHFIENTKTGQRFEHKTKLVD